MRIVLGSDEETPLARHAVSRLGKRGHHVTVVGSLSGQEMHWVEIGGNIARAVAGGDADSDASTQVTST